VAAAVVVDELCRIGVDELDVDGMALIAISDHGDRVTLASSGPLSTRVAELQMTTGEGPGLDAFTIRRPVLGPDMSTTAAARRWPGFAASAVEIGVRAVFAIPLQAGPSAAERCSCTASTRVRSPPASSATPWFWPRPGCGRCWKPAPGSPPTNPASRSAADRTRSSRPAG
jgi:hypothetical protein